MKNETRKPQLIEILMTRVCMVLTEKTELVKVVALYT
jgi:hypothetical protein